MSITKIQLKKITVFDDITIDFSKGLNVLIGENGMGKTHIMKLLYSACQAVKHDVSFSNKVVRVFKPDGLEIKRLINRKYKSSSETKDNEGSIKVFSDVTSIGMTFNSKTTKWDADVKKESEWEKQHSALESIYIPAKEILSNSYNLIEAASKGNVDFDDTYTDIIASAKVDITKNDESTERKKYLDILQKINNGRVTVEKDKFYLKNGNQAKIEFNLVAEGIRKIALLWQLIKNGTLEKGSILFWDEPEANINPVHIPVIADMLLMLQRNGVQIFISTHDYIISKYIEIKSSEVDDVAFYSLYSDKGCVQCESNKTFSGLKHNKISEGFDKLLDDVYKCEVE